MVLTTTVSSSVSRDEFVAFASSRYEQIPLDERKSLLEDWTAELEQFKLQHAEGREDDDNEQAARELELVKGQLRDMVSLRASSDLFSPLFINCSADRRIVSTCAPT